ncbi:MAG: STT3 domain-containing protein [Nitrososphaerota archaeon]
MEIKSSFRTFFKSRPVVLEIAALMSILTIAFIIRMLPIRWGALLSEFDPWMQFRQAEFIVERGWSGFIEYFSWIDMERWYPYGQFVSRSFYPGLPFLLAFVYLSLSSIGIHVNLLELAVVFPVIMSMVAVLVVYFLGKEVGGKSTGLLAAFALAVSNANISRTHAGWFDDESISIPFMLVSFLMYIYAIKKGRSFKQVTVYSVLSGFFLGYVATCWGAHKFPFMFIHVITLLLSFIGRYRRELLVSYSITFGLSSTIATSVPKLGGVGYVGDLTIMTGLSVLVLLVVFELSSNFSNKFLRSFVPRITTVALLVSVGVLATLPGIKFLSTLLPGIRGDLPILISVAENQVSTWVTMFTDLGFFLVFAPVGIYYMLKEGTDEAIFISTLTVFSIYFSASMVRLSVLAAPFIAITSGYAISRIFNSLGNMITIKTKRRKGEKVPIEYAIVTPILVVLLLAVPLAPSFLIGRSLPSLSPIDQAYVPPTVIQSTLPVAANIPDWVNALSWMRDNLPDNAVVAAWWDYGYWITVMGNKTTLADNSTTNSTQIGVLALAFMSPPEKAAQILKQHGATHVLIFVTHEVVPYAGKYFPRLLGYGDEGKWVWMLKIANQEADKLGIQPFNENDYYDPTKPLTEGATDKFWKETLLGQLIPYKPSTEDGNVVHYYEEPNVSGFKLIYSSSPPYRSYAYVYIYELTD